MKLIHLHTHLDLFLVLQFVPVFIINALFHLKCHAEITKGVSKSKIHMEENKLIDLLFRAHGISIGY